MTGPAGGAVLAAWAARVPVDVDRDTAARLARQELADPVYHRSGPSLLERALWWLLDRVADLFDAVAHAAPGGWYGLVLLGVLCALAVLVIRHRLGPVARRRGTGPAEVFQGRPQTAADHRAAADAHAAAGRFDAAVRERFRAVVRELEERGHLDPVPGRTAGEVARAAAGPLPELAADLAAGAEMFGAVVYGGRRAGAAADAQLRDLDARVRAARSRPGPPAAAGAAR